MMRQAIARWLRKCADKIEREYPVNALNYRAGYQLREYGVKGAYPPMPRAFPPAPKLPQRETGI